MIFVAVLDHRSARPARSSSATRSSRIGDPRPAGLQGARLVGVAGDRVGRGLDVSADRVGGELLAADGVDPAGRPVERLVDPRGQVADRRPEALDLAGPGHDPAGPPQDHDEAQRPARRTPASGRRTASSTTSRRSPGRSARPCPKLGEQRLADLEQVADHDQVGEVGDGRIRDRG